MPSEIRHHLCPACGHRHSFALPAGAVDRDGEYAYVCPETGRRAVLRAAEDGRPCGTAAQGAVALEPAAARPGSPALGLHAR